MYENDPLDVQAAVAAMQTAGDKVTLTPTSAVEIVEFGFIVTTALVDTAGDGLVAKVDKRVTAGSDTGRGDGDGGTLTLTQAQAAALTAGKVVRSRPKQPVVVLPGQQAVLELTNAVATSGAAIGFIKYKHKPTYLDENGVETVVTA